MLKYRRFRDSALLTTYMYCTSNPPYKPGRPCFKPIGFFTLVFWGVDRADAVLISGDENKTNRTLG